jgi:hypothetical protein
MNADAKKRYNDVDLPFVCPVTNRVFESVKGLSIYLTKTLKISHREYYDKYIHHRDNKCYFCNEVGKFISVGKGYRNLCENIHCIEKSFKSNSVDGIRYRENCSYEEAVEIFNNMNVENLDKRTSTMDLIFKDNPNFYKEKSRNCKEYWIKKGYSDEDSLLKSQLVMKEIHKKTSIKKKTNYDKYKHVYNTNIEYYLNKGYSIKDSKILLSERQNTFSKQKCINKYGVDIGLEIWDKRQKKWLETLKSKSEEEKNEINLKKIQNKSGFSKISQDLFWVLYKENSVNDIMFGELNNEFAKYDNDKGRYYKYDYVDHTNKKVIEFNGDYWHCNPNKFTYDYNHEILEKKAEEIWGSDEIKNNLIIKDGYELLVIWESDYILDPYKTIIKCIEFLKK